MQSKKGGKQYFVRDKAVPWYKSKQFSIGIMLFSIAVWFACSMRTLNTINFETKRLILRSEGCAYLQIHHFQTHTYPITNTCVAEAPFKYLPFSDNGLIWADDESTVFVNGSQIVAVEALPDRPWPPARRRDFTYVAIGTLVYLGIFIFMVVNF